MASKSVNLTSSTISDKDEEILKKFSDFHIFLNELQESNRRILKRLDDLLQTSEEDHRLRFQEEHGNALIELENRIKLIESNDLKREKELKELQQSLKILMEKREHAYGIFSEGNPRATVRSLEKNVEINAAGISDIGAFQQQSDMMAVGRTFIQHELSFVTPEHSSAQIEGILEGKDQDMHAASSPNVSSEHEIERPFLEGSVSGDTSKLRLVKTPGFSALDIPRSESTGLNVIKEHPSSLRDSKETSVDSHVGHILRSEMEEVLTENISSSENSTIDASVDNHTQGNRSINVESDIVSVYHGVDYNFGSLQRKDVEQRDPEEKKVQPSGNAYTESESGYVSSRSDTSVYSDHELIAANLPRHSVNKNSDSGGKNSWSQRSKNVVPRVKKAAASSASYSNQPVLKLIAYDHVTSSDNQLQQNSSHVAEHQDNKNFSKTKMPVKENIDLDHDVKVEAIYPMMWKVIAKAEYDEGKKNKVHGVHTVLCVDISASMRGGEAWDQARIFVSSFLSGLEEVVSEGIRNRDCVALSVFGHETRVVQRLTDDFHLLRTSFDNLKLGGPTQMFGGLVMAMAGLGAQRYANFNNIIVYPRIILISDGKPSLPSLRAGPDIYDESDQQQIESEIFEVVDGIAENHTKIYCIPVGLDPNVAFAGHVLQHWKSMNTMQSYFGGEVSLEDLIMGMERGSLAAMAMPGSGAVAIQSKSDKEYILALAKEALEEEAFEEADIMSSFYESTDPSSGLPPVGSRVRRGPDWMHEMQDNGGPGTVVGHIKEKKHEILVTWDRNEETANYRYGLQEYDVVLVEEPRLLQFDELIGTGCVVQRGKDWKWNNQDGVPGTKGIVIKVLENGKVIVRWPDKSKNVYRFGADGCFDLEICNPFENCSDGRMTQAASGVTLSFGQQETNNINSSFGGGASAAESSGTASKNQKFGKNIIKNKNAK